MIEYLANGKWLPMPIDYSTLAQAQAANPGCVLRIGPALPISVVMPVDTPDSIIEQLGIEYGRDISWDDDYILNDDSVIVLHFINHTEGRIMHSISKHCMLANIIKVIR